MSTMSSTPKQQQQDVTPLSETEIIREFLKKDSFDDFSRVALYESVVDPRTGKEQGLVHIMNPYDPNAVVVSLGSQASQADVEKIAKSISATPEFCAILSKLVECYQTRRSAHY